MSQAPEGNFRGLFAGDCASPPGSSILERVSLSRFVKRSGMKARALLAVLVATLVLNGIAYLTHVDAVGKAGGSVAHTELCGYCAAFGGLAGSSADLPAPQLPVPLLALTVLLLAAPVLRRHVTAARPRAPPVS